MAKTSRNPIIGSADFLAVGRDREQQASGYKVSISPETIRRLRSAPTQAQEAPADKTAVSTINQLLEVAQASDAGVDIAPEKRSLLNRILSILEVEGGLVREGSRGKASSRMAEIR